MKSTISVDVAEDTCTVSVDVDDETKAPTGSNMKHSHGLSDTRSHHRSAALHTTAR